MVTVDQFGEDAVRTLFEVADEMSDLVESKGGDDRCKGKLLATLFYESSTRTACSFQAAMARLGGTSIHVNESTSSSTKGETLTDTVACLQTYCDVLAIRHPTVGSALSAASVGYKPVLNAGDGVGEHPTQALLDLYTIISETQGGLEGKTIALLGDLKHGRTVHSLSRLLSRYGCKLRYVSPPGLKMPADLVEELSVNGKAEYSEHAILDDVLAEADVLYVTRIQKERFSSPDEYEALKGSYVITPEVLARAKSDMILLHPLPRVGEIAEDCDSDPRAKYFKQMENGMLVRMALLALVLGKA
jgi:aspartate carbamoyltransferase catalytic subunit